MNIEEKKAKLMLCKIYEQEHEYLFNRLAEIREKLYGKADIRAVNYSPVPKVKNDYSKDFTDRIDDLIDQEKEIAKKIYESISKQFDLEMEIDEAREKLLDYDVDLARVIGFRYLDGYTIEETAEKMNRSRDTVLRKQKRALELIEI